MGLTAGCGPLSHSSTLPRGLDGMHAQPGAHTHLAPSTLVLSIRMAMLGLRQAKAARCYEKGCHGCWKQGQEADSYPLCVAELPQLCAWLGAMGAYDVGLCFANQ